MTATEQTATAEQTPRRKRRKWPWILTAVVLVVLLGFGGAVFYLSNLLGSTIAVNQRPAAPDNVEVTEVTGTTFNYNLGEGSNDSWADLGHMALTTSEGGWLLTDRPAGASNTRTVLSDTKPPGVATGQVGRFDGFYFCDNPQAGMGIAFQNVKYSSPVGQLDAWMVPGDADATTWVIFTHGLGASPREGLRTLETTHKLGYPTMLITYRNDIGQPRTDGYVSFGQDEWEDLQGAVQYALDHGATKVFLAGNSHGGAVTLGFLERSKLASRVTGVFLDGPATNFSRIVDETASSMGAPQPLTDVAKLLAQQQYDIDWSATDYTQVADSFTTPMTIVQGTADTTVPPDTTRAFADAVNAAHPGLVDLQLFEGAPHTTEWNQDRTRFNSILSQALQQAGPANG